MKRTQTAQLDNLSIFCHILVRKEKKKVVEVAKILGKHHATVLYHLKRFDDINSVSKAFKRKIEEFDIRDFIENYTQNNIAISESILGNIENYIINWYG